MKNLLLLASFLLLLFLAGCQVQGISGPGKTTTLGYDLNRLEIVTSDKTNSLPLSFREYSK